MRTRALRLVLALAVSTVGLVAVPSPAQAQVCSSHSGGGSACVDGMWITTCDNQVDGHRVRSHIRFSSGGTVYYTGWAPSQGCYREGHLSRIYEFRVCIEEEGCTAWKRQ